MFASKRTEYVRAMARLGRRSRLNYSLGIFVDYCSNDIVRQCKEIDQNERSPRNHAS